MMETKKNQKKWKADGEKSVIHFRGEINEIYIFIWSPIQATPHTVPMKLSIL